MTADAIGLYTTLAASAAALVAIVGGFLVARLVSISAERDGMLRRRRDHQRDLAEAESQLAQAVRERQAEDEREFREELVFRAAAYPTIQPGELAARSKITSSPMHDRIEYAIRLLASV